MDSVALHPRREAVVDRGNSINLDRERPTPCAGRFLKERLTPHEHSNHSPRIIRSRRLKPYRPAL
jgi:hypothetical protein